MALQQGVFNVTDPTWNILPSNTPTMNTTNLQTLVDTLLDSSGPTQGSGGTIQFPSVGKYRFNDAITIGRDLSNNKQPASIIIMGTGQGHITAPILEQENGSADLFIVDNNTGSSEDIGGVVFQDLMINYASGASGSHAAIHVVGASNSVKLLRVTLVNCPIGAWFANSLTCSMIDCNVYNSTNAGIGLQLGTNDGSLTSAIETFVSGCSFLSFNQPNGVAAQVYGCEHLRMINSRLESYGQGIIITTGANIANIRHLYFGNVSSFPTSTSGTTGAAVLIQTGTSAAAATQIWFDHCEFTPAGGSTTYAGGGIVIQPGSTGPIDQVRFVDCYSCLWPGPGMNIVGGTNIEVLGGFYSCNGTGAHVPFGYSQSGIAITGPASGVRITGAACNNSVYDLFTSPPGPAPTSQVYGVYVGFGASSIRIASCDLTGNLGNGVLVTGSSSAPSNVFVKHCDFTGLSNPLSVTAPVTNLEVTECPGYNNQATVLQSTIPPPANPITNRSPWANVSQGWFGHIAFYVKGAGHVTIDGFDTNLTDGGYTLAPGESASIAGTATHFLAVGK